MKDKHLENLAKEIREIETKDGFSPVTGSKLGAGRKLEEKDLYNAAIWKIEAGTFVGNCLEFAASAEGETAEIVKGILVEKIGGRITDSKERANGILIKIIKP